MSGIDTTKTLNQSVGKGNFLGGLNSAQIFALLVIATLVGSGYVLLDWDWRLCFVVFIFPTGIVMSLTFGSKSNYMEKIGFISRYTLSFQGIHPASHYAPEKRKKTPQATLLLRRLRKPQRDHINPIEAESDLIVPVEFDLGGESVGCYLLRNKNNEWFGVFGWSVEGLDPSLTNEEARIHNQKADEALRGLPAKALLTVEASSFCGDRPHQEQLEQLLFTAKTPLEQALVRSQQQNIRQLRRAHRIQRKRTLIYLQYPEAIRRDSDWMDWLLFKSQELLRFLTNQSSTLPSNKRLKRMLLQVYENGYRRYSTLLSDRLSQSMKALSAAELLRKDYLETHTHAEDLIVPQLVRLSRRGLTLERIDTTTHVNSHLFKSQNGFSACPEPQRQYIKLHSRGLFCGAVQVGKALAYFSPEGADLGQVRFLSEVLESNGVYDYRVVTQIGGTSRAVQKFQMERQTREKAKIAEWTAKGDGVADVGSTETIKDMIDARAALHRGTVITTVATAIFLYRSDHRQLSEDLGFISDAFGATPCERCWERMMEFWVQSQAWSATPLFKKPYERRVKLQSDETSGYLPLIKPRRLDTGGIHFLGAKSAASLWFDPYEIAQHLAIFATTRAGKSVLLADLILNFLIREFPVVGFDFPKPTTGASTFKDLIHTLKALGAPAEYYNTAAESANLIELPKLEGLDNEQERIKSILQFHKKAILVLGVGRLNDPSKVDDVQVFVNDSYDAFHADPEIQHRYQIARSAGFDNLEYALMPTLIDYLEFLEKWVESYRSKFASTITPQDEAAMGLLLRNLRSRLNGKLAKAIAAPSSVNPNSQLLMFALKELDDPIEAAVYALSAYSILLRKAVTSPKCAFVIDESPVLFKFEAIVDIVAHLCTNGLKWGCRVITSSQTASTITRTKAGPEIMQTIFTKMVGYITTEAIPSLEDIGFRADLLKDYTNAEKSRDAQVRDLASRWIIKRGLLQIEALYIPSPLLLSLVANNEEEQAARDRVMAMYPDDPLSGALAFSELYIHCIKNRLSLDLIGTSLLPQHLKECTP